MKTFIYICLLVIGLVLPAGAQVPIQSYRGKSPWSKPHRAGGNSLRLDLTISVCGLSVGRYQTLSLMPMLRSDRDSVVMAPVVLNGANKQKMYDRTLVFEEQESRRWRRLYGNQEHPGTDPRNPLWTIHSIPPMDEERRSDLGWGVG